MTCTSHRPAETRLDRVRQLYRAVAPGYDAFRTIWSRWTQAAETELDRLFDERIGPESRILELAPGTGVNLARLERCAPEFRSYIGVDASEEMLRRAREKAADDPRVELLLGDVTDLRELPGPFDFIVSTWLLSHLEDPASLVSSALTRLANGGTAVFLFSTAPRAGWLRWLLLPFYRSAAARFVDPRTLHPLPGLEKLSTSANGLATLAVFVR
jgi:ubiquinone/menaquinone biosynthesis C-methylase UbiE